LLQDLEAAATTTPMPDGSEFNHSSMSIISKEFESFIGQKQDNTKMIVFLTDMFDCSEMPTKYRTKGSGSNVIPSVFVNLLGATTPESIASFFPSSAVGGGLASRILFIWADNKKCKSPRPSMTPAEKVLEDKLLKDLFQISRITGEYGMSDKADKYWYDWYMKYEENDKNRICLDRAFSGWYARKPTYILKLAINRAASESNDLIIEHSHILKAINDIESVEYNMGLVFRAMGKSTFSSEIDQVMQLIFEYKWISEARLMSMCWRDIDDAKMANVIATVCKTGKITKLFKGPKGETGIWYKSNE
jgi:hypothetical protein